jgi:small conductance mechanosensitive channel
MPVGIDYNFYSSFPYFLILNISVTMESIDLNKLLAILQELMMSYGLKLLGALVVLIIGLWLIKFLTRTITRLMEARNVEPSLRSFLRTAFSIIMKLLLVIIIATMIGIPMTSFVAILGAAGLAVGLALSGTLQNFAGGVMILLFKPYKVGDYVEAQGYTGTIKEIQIFHTVMLTVDNKTIIIPNGPLSTGSLINYSKEPLRRVDLTIGISYGNSFENAKEVLNRLIAQDDRILKEPEPFIGLNTMADSSINLVVRLWVNADDYWGVYFRMNNEVYNEFPKNGLSFPFPQMDVHLVRS